jgi:hypothetical protein
MTPPLHVHGARGGLIPDAIRLIKSRNDPELPPYPVVKRCSAGRITRGDRARQSHGAATVVGAVMTCRPLWVALVVITVTAPSRAWGTTRLIYDHLSGKMSLNSDRNAIADGDVIHVPPGKITVEVRSTNTALYTYSVDVAEAESQEAKALRSFLPVLKTYVPGLAKPGEGVVRTPGTPVDSKMSEISNSLHLVDHVQAMALEALARMSEPRLVRAEADRFHREAAQYISADPAPRLLLADSIAAQLSDLSSLLIKRPNDATKEARDLVASAPTLLDQVHAVEKLVTAVGSAEDHSSQDAGTLTPAHSRSVTLSVMRKSDPLFAGFASTPDRKVSVQFEPRWFIHPAVGVTLIYSNESEYATFDANGTRTGSQDDRITYGLSLSLTHRSLVWDESGWTLWPLDFTLNPSDNVRAYGLGSAVSWNAVKLAMGALWTKHQEVRGSEVAETYGDPKFFVGLAVAGWLE